MSNYEGQQETISATQFTQEMRKRHVFTQEEQYALGEIQGLSEENEQLRALLARALDIPYHEPDYGTNILLDNLAETLGYERTDYAKELADIREQAKSLGVEVTE